MRALVLLAALAFASPSWATTIYADGSLGGDCVGSYNTSTRLCSGGSATADTTIAGAIARISGGGDTVYIRAGTYNEALSSFPSGSSWVSAVTIAAYSGETVTVRPSSGRPLNVTGATSYVIFDSIIFNGSLLSGVNEIISIGSGGSHHIRLTNVEGTTNADGQIVQVSYDASFIEFIGGSYHGGRENEAISPRGGYCFYAAGDNNLWDGVEAYDCVGIGILLYVNSTDHMGFDMSGNVVKNSYVHDIITAPTYANGIGIMAGGSGGVDGSDTDIFNNVVEDIQPGWALSISFDNTRVYHNTFAYTSNEAIDTGSAANTLNVRNNIFAHTGGVQLAAASGVTQTNNRFYSGTTGATGSDTTGDPLFVTDSANGDFHLQSGSPILNSGANLFSVVATDKDGVARDTSPAIGAYEFATAGNPDRARLR